MLTPGRQYSATSSYRYGFNGKEDDNEVKGEGNEVDYGRRVFDSRIGKFLSVDPLTKKYPQLTPYQFASNSPISGIDLDGLEYYFAADGKFIGNGPDPKNMEVRLAKITGKTPSGNYTLARVDLDGKLQQNWTVIHSNYGEFKKMAGVLYTEASKKASANEVAGIFSVLKNRASYENTSVLAQMTVAKGVNGAGDANQINLQKGADADMKRQAVYSGLIKGLVSNKDFSNGAFYWDGLDFNPVNKKHGGYDERYTPGFEFTDPSHDLYGQGSNVNPGSLGGVGWNYKYESTQAIGKTTFSKLTDDWRDAQYPDKVDKKGNVIEKRYAKKVGAGWTTN